MLGFEPFTVDIYNRITEEGEGTFYIFDCLSELQVAWHTDQMMGNFFRVTCPYLYELNTVAYFPIIRGHHSFETSASIRDTTQVLIDVYMSDSAVYIHTLKALGRDTMNIYLPARQPQRRTLPPPGRAAWRSAATTSCSTTSPPTPRTRISTATTASSPWPSSSSAAAASVTRRSARY